MDKIKDQNKAPVSPYDDTLWDHYSIYDNIPYTFDTDLNVEKVFRKVSGNIIKSYRCKMLEPIELKRK